jgi:hypothetical protein
MESAENEETRRGDPEIEERFLATKTPLGMLLLLECGTINGEAMRRGRTREHSRKEAQDRQSERCESLSEWA